VFSGRQFGKLAFSLSVLALQQTHTQDGGERHAPTRLQIVSNQHGGAGLDLGCRSEWESMMERDKCQNCG
jgi:hypothetical protein